MLLSAKVPLPKELFVHGFMQLSGQKMGKSTGNVVDPISQIEKFGVDGFRFYLLGSMPMESDGNYSNDLIVERFNHELVANVSNFWYRAMSFTNNNYDSKLTDFDSSEPLIKEIEAKFSEIKLSFEKRDLKEALAKILEVSAMGNRYMQEKAPWKNKDKAQEVLTLSINIVKNLSILLEPFMPSFSKELQKQLNLSELKWDDLGFNLKNHTIGKAEIIVKKYVEKVEDEPKVVVDSHPFSAVNLKVGNIKEIEDHPDADRLFVLKIDLGNEERQLVAGLREHYKKEELLGKNMIIVYNLKPAKLKGIKSQGMLLAATSKDGKVTLVSPSKSRPGDQVFIEGVTPKESRITIDEFFERPLKVKNGKVVFENSVLKTDKEEISVDSPDSSTVG
jgi:methionyl-tRNA synthetase